MAKEIFLSYSNKDKSLARKIARDLGKKGINVWLADWEIFVGDSISQKIQNGLKKTRFIAVLLSKHSIKSNWVEKEWQTKIDCEVRDGNVTILPLKADDCEIPPLLKDKKYANFTKNYEYGLNELIQAVKRHLNKEEGESFSREGTNAEKKRGYLSRLQSVKHASILKKVLLSVVSAVVGSLLIYYIYLVLDSWHRPQPKKETIKETTIEVVPEKFYRREENKKSCRVEFLIQKQGDEPLISFDYDVKYGEVGWIIKWLDNDLEQRKKKESKNSEDLMRIKLRGKEQKVRLQLFNKINEDRIVQRIVFGGCDNDNDLCDKARSEDKYYISFRLKGEYKNGNSFYKESKFPIDCTLVNKKWRFSIGPKVKDS